MADPASTPLFFEPNRVWRCYTGGALLDLFLGTAPADTDFPADWYFPEDWLASCVLAVNGEHSQGPDEGLSRLRGEGGTPGPFLRDVVASDPAAFLGGTSEMTLLCKYLDSAVRLPIQCHPDKEFARAFYGSEHGKSESWLILGTRAIDGEEPYLLLGFKPGIRPADFREAVLSQDIPALESLLHRVPVQAGEAYFIPGRFPHAIGPGVFLLEVQEPSDWVIQPERFCAGTQLSDTDMWGPLDPETALTCFRYDGESMEHVRERLQKHPVPAQKTSGGTLSHVIGSETTSCFGVDFLHVSSEFDLEHPAPYYLVVITSGTGSVSWEGGTSPVTQGDVFFVPHGVRRLQFEASGGSLDAYLCLPGV